ncbi:MAG TPA: hypothetical protein H9794_04560 [Candidatus Mediterraneibacter merdigallinarum]|nr:hypothetical protein [Candidatus Mediterraneibacter merdigallinarum]
MGNLFDELRYNIKNSVFVNVILIIQFILFFWQSTMILSYFLDMPLYEFPWNIPGDTTYYSLTYSFSNEEGKEAMRTQGSNPDYISNQAKVYAELHENPDLHFMTFSNMVAISVEYETLRENFTDQELLDFFCDSEYPGQYNPADTPPETLTAPSYIEEVITRYETKICRMDQQAMEHFKFQIEEGRLLEEEDFDFTWGQKIIPVLVGSAYGSGFDIGDRLAADMYGTGVELEVVGILKADTVIYTDEIYTLSAEPYSLDYAIILPFFYITDPPENEDQRFLAEANYDEAFQSGMIAVDKDTPTSEVRRIEKELNQIFVKNGLYAVSTDVSTYGLDIFRTESQETLEILLGASVLVGALTISGICMSIITKLNRNLKRYGTEIMNGQSVGTILAAFLLEILLVIAAAMMFTVWKFMDLIQLNPVFLLVILALALFSVLIVSAIFIRKLLKVDIEEIIRSEE